MATIYETEGHRSNPVGRVLEAPANAGVSCLRGLIPTLWWAGRRPGSSSSAMRVCRVASRWFRWSVRSQKHARQHKGEQDCGDNDDDPDQKERDGLPPSAPPALVNDGPVLPTHRDHAMPTYRDTPTSPRAGSPSSAVSNPGHGLVTRENNLTTAPTQAARMTAVVLQRLWSLQGDAVSVSLR